MTWKPNFKTLLITFSVISVLLFSHAGFASAAENGALNNAQAQIEFAADAADVTISYSVFPPEEGKEMPIEVLQVEGISIEEVRAYDATGQDLPVKLEDTGMGKLAGTVELDAGRGQGETIEVNVSYRVTSALKTDNSGADVNIPLVTASWPPVNAVPGVFISNLRIPTGYNYVDGFPAGPKLTEDQSGTVIRHDLQVLPAFIRVRLTSGKVPFITFPWKMVLGTAVVIAAAVIMGFTRYKKGS